MQSKTPKREGGSPSLETIFILDQCAAIETRCGDLYRYFAELCEDQPELQTLWKKTAHEEDHHALQFKMLGRLKGDGMTGVTIDAARATKALESVESLFTKIKASRITEVEMLQVAIRLETYLSQYHSNSVVICSEPELKHLLDSMMKFDLDHLETLEKALEKVMGERV